MKRLVDLFCGLALLLLTLSSCVSAPRAASGTPDQTDTLYKTQYAQGFDLFRSGESTLLKVKNPWQGAEGVDKWVFLSRNGEAPPAGFTGEVIEVPVRRVVCMSSSYVAFMEALGSETEICGVSGAKFLSGPRVRERIAAKQIADVGYDNNLNYELLVSLQPDLILIYGVTGENSAITDKLHELGLRVVYIGDYLENSPLGRAEWIVPIAEFLDKRPAAERHFEAVCSEYEAVKGLAAAVKTRPTVMLNAPWRDTWFVPGDRNYMVQLIADAGGNYACAGVDSEQSRPISSETAFVHAAESDFWLNPGTAASLADLRVMNPNFKTIKSMRDNRVFNNNARNTPEGGSDFWESGTVSPQVVLKDLIRILHPDLLPDHQLYYYQQLQ